MNASSMRWLALVITAACGGPRALSKPCALPSAGHGWESLSASEAGFDEKALCSLLTELSTSPLNIHSVLMERHGKLVAELYRAAPDRPISIFYGVMNPRSSFTAFDAETLHDLRSITKSVTALAAGVAALPPLDRRVVDQFHELKDLQSTATLEHVLTMSTGLEWHEWGEGVLSSDETGLTFEADQLSHVLNRKVLGEPGSRFNYNSGNTAVLAELITRTTGQPLEDFVRKVLFTPLGITDFEWVTDGHRRPLANAGLRLLPRDALKFGRLMIDHGRWGQVQVVPSEWVDDSMKPLVSTGLTLFSLTGEPVSYGRQWWNGEMRFRERTLTWVCGVGNGGQRLFIVPELDLTILLTGGDYGDPQIQREENVVLLRLLETLSNL